MFFQAISRWAVRCSGSRPGRCAVGLALATVAGVGLPGSVVADVLDDARVAESAGNYLQARVLYHRYLEQMPAGFDRRALTLRASVLAEAVRYGPDAAVPLMLEALTARENGDIDLALDILRIVDIDHAGSTLHDDALYMSGYIALMDRVDFELAHEYLRRVQTEYPDSNYIDTAMYSEAIALEQLGNTQGARSLFAALRDKHTRFSSGFLDQYWPRGTVLSRYWFDRASRRLEMLDIRSESAAKLVERMRLTRGNLLRITVNVDGVDLVLLLHPSQVTSNVVIKDADNAVVPHPAVRYYAGKVEGDEQSWARIALNNDSVEGLVFSYGMRYVLEPDSMVGTIEYYRPRSTTTKAGVALQDYVMYPPDADDSVVRRVISAPAQRVGDKSDVTRVARLSIVVDSQYDDYYGGNGLSRALSDLNISDGIYRQEFGLALQVESAIVFNDRDSDPMNLGPVTLEQTLRSFRDYRLMHAADLPDVGLVYLFSGNRNTDQAIGLAWIGAACRLDGFDVGVTTPSLFGDLLVTHELGHSLGALHDTDTSCSANTNRLMWPRISSLTEQEFTNCSMDVVSSRLQQSCHVDALDLSLDVQLPDQSTIEAIIRNTDDTRTLADARLILDRAAVPFASVPPQCIETNAAELECRTGMLAPGESLTLVFTLVEDDEIPVMSLLMSVTPVGALDVNPANNSAQIDMTQTVDGETAIEVASVATGSSADSAGTVGMVPAQPPQNDGGAAVGAVLWLLLPGFLCCCRLRARRLLRRLLSARSGEPGCCST